MAQKKNNHHGSKWVAASIVMIGIFITLLNGTIVDVMLPKMMASLNTDTYCFQWGVIAYLIAAAIAMTNVDWLSSVLGHGYTHLLGLVIFTFSRNCMDRHMISVLWSSRVSVRGSDRALLFLSVCPFSAKHSPRKNAAWHLTSRFRCKFAPVLGPTLGGTITEHLNWRWIFFVNLPIGLIGIFLTFLCFGKPVIAL